MNMTPKEAEILGLLAQGVTNTEMTQKLGVSYQTISNHLTNIIRKTGIDRRPLLAFYALKAGYATQQQIDAAIDQCVEDAKEKYYDV